MSDNGFLDFTFTNVNRWLEYAERKTTFLFSSFSLIALMTVILNNISKIDCLLKISSVISIGLYLVSLFFTFLSLFPVTQISKSILENGKDKKIKPDDNLFFYADISKYSYDEYLKSINAQYDKKFEDNKINRDLINQIIINANITTNKFQSFKISVVFLFLAILQFSVCYSITIILN